MWKSIRPGRRIAAAVLACTLLLAEDPKSQEDVSLEQVRWVTERGARVDVQGRTIGLTGGPGFLRSERLYGDFTLLAEFRVLEPRASAALWMHAWPDGRSLRSYRVTLSDGVQGNQALGRLRADGQKMRMQLFDSRIVEEAKRAVGEWQTLRVESRRQLMRVFLNDVLVSEADEAEETAGYLALESHRGRVDVRDVRIVRLPHSGEPFGEGAAGRGEQDGLDPARLVKYVKVQFPRPVSDAGVQGMVVLEGVIAAEGIVSDVRVVTEVHPDLDEAAIGCVRKWRFSPATRDGVPVPTVARFEIEFRLKA